MTATREALVLPLLFLTVALCGSVRIAQTLGLMPPSLYALILGILLLRLLIQSRALVPGVLLSPARGTLANINGGMVILTLWAASAQVFAVLIPDNGLPRLMVGVFFLILLLNIAAASPDRPRLLRSLAVTFGSAFLLKFVVLAALSESGTSWLKRVLVAMVEGVTLGTLSQDRLHPASGYIALFALGLFLVGVFLLPSHPRPPTTALQTVTEPLAPPSIQHSRS